MTKYRLYITTPNSTTYLEFYWDNPEYIHDVIDQLIELIPDSSYHYEVMA